MKLTEDKTVQEQKNFYKVSNYNFFFDFKDEGRYLIYNSISNGLADVNKDIFDLLKLGDNGLNELENKPAQGDLIKSLHQGNIIVDNDFDEVEFLRVKFNLMRYALRTLALTIVPTLDCNLNCIYCYEGNRIKDFMNEETASAVNDFVKNRLENFGYKGLHITWYGGEPLLYPEIVYRLSDSFLKICKSMKITYGATMVTNGTLINKDIIKKLKKYKVGIIQVTIDGVKEVHDQRRPFTETGKSSFQAIIDNISSVIGVIPINIRINVDKTNFNETVKLLDEFKSKGWLDNRKDIFIYIGYTREWTSHCHNILENCFSMREFSEAEMKFQEELSLKGYNVGNLYPSLTAYCVAASNHGFVIDPGGELHKCWSDVGNREAYLCNIREPLVINKKLLKWLSYEPLTMFTECRECKFFPICAGGCPYVSLFQREKIEKDIFYNCTPWKLFMEKKIKQFIRQRAGDKNNRR